MKEITEYFLMTLLNLKRIVLEEPDSKERIDLGSLVLDSDDDSDDDKKCLSKTSLYDK